MFPKKNKKLVCLLLQACSGYRSKLPAIFSIHFHRTFALLYPPSIPSISNMRRNANARALKLPLSLIISPSRSPIFPWSCNRAMCFMCKLTFKFCCRQLRRAALSAATQPTPHHWLSLPALIADRSLTLVNRPVWWVRHSLLTSLHLLPRRSDRRWAMLATGAALVAQRGPDAVFCAWPRTASTQTAIWK